MKCPSLISFFLASAMAYHIQAAVLEERAATCTFPTPGSTKSLSAVQTVAAGKSFDCGNVRYDRGSGACSGQTEGGDSDAVFLLEEGASLSNCIIGANQAEGVHCKGACTLTNIWFEDVCEDAITLKQGSGKSTVIKGGGAKGASDKVVQHNGGGTVTIQDFCVQNSGKLYRSCGNCSTQYKRTVVIKDIIASSVKLLAGINSNYGDTATISGVTASSVTSYCDTYQGTTDNDEEPVKLTSNQKNDYCKF
ncbi:hypothetical protein IE53DRAFT_369532 [Violaceomyces palustris]|uniref:Uncharacterized protein n=1 Tax=Violaceomyces palustris TaxID=1673888 RepID=A0ACD0NVE9_9BASI|nr:hypothetical protein IE53DRAFT_369532 [Violaceomyces palustris]